MIEQQQATVVTYPAPEGAVGNADFSVRVRAAGGPWIGLFTYEVRVDMHQVREASMVTFDMEGSVEVEVTCHREQVRYVDIRPLAREIVPIMQDNVITFQLERPSKLSIEVNGERFHNLHLFANGLERHIPDPHGNSTHYVEAGTYLAADVVRCLNNASLRDAKVIYFGPGLHQFEDGQFFIPSGKTVYLAGGAIVVGSFMCVRVENVTIRGRGIVFLRDIAKTTYWRTVEINYSRNVTVEGIVSIDPPHYSIHLGQSENVHIRNFKSFSTRGWCDGIDMMSCSNIDIDDVFLRTSDDCIAIYGSRGAFKGDSSNIRVRNSILWADVAHPIMVGCHGDHEGDGDTIENLVFHQLDILEHHEPQDGYWGCMTINAGDKNTVRQVTFSQIRVEQFELGRLFDVRVFQNPKYNPHPGNRVERIRFEDITFDGHCDNPSIINGYDEARIVDGVHFHNLRINGRLIESLEEGNFECNAFQRNVTFSVR